MIMLRKALAFALCALALSAHAAESDETAPVAAPPISKTAVADFATCAKPVWPQHSRRHEETGTVTLAFLIGLDGSVVESKVLKSSGFALLDAAALEGIGKCKFRPGTKNGVPVESWMRMQYVWSLK